MRYTACIPNNVWRSYSRTAAAPLPLTIIHRWTILPFKRLRQIKNKNIQPKDHKSRALKGTSNMVFMNPLIWCWACMCVWCLHHQRHLIKRWVFDSVDLRYLKHHHLPIETFRQSRKMKDFQGISWFSWDIVIQHLPVTLKDHCGSVKPTYKFASGFLFLFLRRILHLSSFLWGHDPYFHAQPMAPS